MALTVVKRTVPARLLKPSRHWREEILYCPSCGWRGKFESGSTMIYEAMIESSCPRCDHGVLAMLPWPGEETPDTEVR